MRAVLAMCCALAACGGPSGSPDGGIDAPGEITADAGPDAPPCPTTDAGPVATGFPAQLVIGPAQGVIDDPFTIQVSGSGASMIGAASFDADVGTLALGGAPVQSFLYMTTPFGAGLTLYQGFAVGPSRWDVFWLYCTSGTNGTELTSIWDEGIDGPALFPESATGTCNGGNSSTNAQVALPASTIASPTPVDAPFTVHGASIDVEHGAGTLTLAGAALPLVVFGTVDCSQCGSPGWYELHSVVWDAAHQRTIFVIVYLIDGTMSSVELTYARALPDLSDPIGTIDLPATWSTGSSCPGVRARASTRGFGVPPPSLRARAVAP